jgi:isopentenyl phosphate kinase
VTTTVARPEAAAARRIVIKVGSSVLARDGHLRSRVFGDIARQVASLLDEGREVVIVSSGAIAVGSRTLGWDGPGHSIPEKQAAAAVGQIGLIDLYGRRFAKYGRKVAQVLVTRVGLEDRDRFLNARHTLQKLLELGVVPIVNENDTVATDEIRFGDNDNLSATVLNLVGGDLLVILTDVDGLYADAPVPGAPTPPLIEVVDGITPAIERAAHGSASAFGRGGMTTKLEAAQAAARCVSRRARHRGPSFWREAAWQAASTGSRSPRARWAPWWSTTAPDGRCSTTAGACSRPASPRSGVISVPETPSPASTARGRSWPAAWSPTPPTRSVASCGSRPTRSSGC